MGSPIQTNDSSKAIVMAAPGGAIGLTLSVPSGSYKSNASGQATINGADVPFAMNLGWVPLTGTVLMYSPGSRPGSSFTGPGGTSYTSGFQGSAEILQSDATYAASIGWSPSFSGTPTYTPLTLDTVGINAAIVLASITGGAVQLPSGAINLVAPGLNLPSNVTLQGVPPNFGYTGTIDIGQIFSGSAGGTWLVGNGTFPIISGNSTDLTSPPYTSVAGVAQLSISRSGIRNLGVYNGTYGIKLGGHFNPGPFFCQFENIAALNCTQWGIWIENQAYCTYRGHIESMHNTAGQVRFHNSTHGTAGNGGVAFNGGNATVENLLTLTDNALQRNLVISCDNSNVGSPTVSGAIDLLKINYHQCVSNVGATQTNATFNGTTTIALGTTANLQVGMPVTFLGCAANGFNNNQAYFVLSIVGNNITVGNDQAGTGGAITGTGSTTVTNGLQTAGWPAVEINGFSTTNQATFISCDSICEGSVPITYSLDWASQCKIQTMESNVGVAVTSPSSFQMATFVLRNSVTNRIDGGQQTGCSIDRDLASSSCFFTGLRNNMGNVNATLTAPIPGIGISIEASSARDIQPNSVAINLLGNSPNPNYAPDISISQGSGCMYLRGPGAWGNDGIQPLASGQGISPGTGFVQMYTGAGGGNLTLPTISTSKGSTYNLGVFFLVVNPSSGTLTLNTSSSQTVNGTGTSFVMAANSMALCYATNNGGTLFWGIR